MDYHAGFRLWQDKLSTQHPYWVAAGIEPSAALQHGQTWKQLLLSACQLRNHQGSHGNPDATVLQTQSTTLKVWLPGMR